VFGVLVFARQQSGADAINPLFSGHHGSAYSDVFLAMAAVAVLTLIVASRMRPAPAPEASAAQEANTVH